MPLLTHTGVLSPESRSASELRRAPWFVLGANGFDGGRGAGGSAEPGVQTGSKNNLFAGLRAAVFAPLKSWNCGTFTFIFRGFGTSNDFTSFKQAASWS